MGNILALVGIKTKIILVAMAVAACMGWWKWHNYQQQQIGAAKLQSRLQADDRKTIQEKRQNDVEIRNQSDDDLLNEFGPRRVPN